MLDVKTRPNANLRVNDDFVVHQPDAEDMQPRKRQRVQDKPADLKTHGRMKLSGQTKDLSEYRTTNSARNRRAARFSGVEITGHEGFTGAKPANEPSSPGQKKVKCRFFPNCSNKDCPFIHPTETCKYFPACTAGSKCIYLHPEVECKFGTGCTRANCNFKHSKGKGAARSGVKDTTL